MKAVKHFFLLISLYIFSQFSYANFNPLTNFGVNPGSLEASYYTPQKKTSSLVVLLHGCTQNGKQLAKQSGLLGLAEQHKFSLLIPQQGLMNNIKRCFNWYSEDDNNKDKGENLSLKNMITSLKEKSGSKNVYIIGLSAGGAMTSSLLVNYPELFTAGAVIAGVPYVCADGFFSAISCMKNGPPQNSNALMILAKKLNPQQTQWPQLSVWTGNKDNVVNSKNATYLAQQWVKITNINTPAKIESFTGYKISQWQNNHQQIQVELVQLDNLGHGITVNPEEKNGGEVADYLLTAPISTIKHVINLWDLNK